MADEENVNVAETETNEVIETENIVDFQSTEGSINAIDWQKIGDIALKILNYSSIVAAYLGAFAFLSYTILHVINYFCHIESFMKTLPLGYTMTISGFEECLGFVTTTFIIFGCVCVFIALKLGLWLIQKHSIASRICCILLGSGFLYLMIDKQANDILLFGLTMLSAIIVLIFVGIPGCIIIHNLFLPFFRGLVPSVFTYYKFLFSFFPHTSGLMNLCDGVKKSVDIANENIAEQSRKAQEEADAQRQRQEQERIERETISSAVQKGNNVTVYGLHGNILFTKSGTLRGYTSSTVNILRNGTITTYSGSGSIMYSKSVR